MSDIHTSLGLPNKIRIDCSQMRPNKYNNALGTKVYLNDVELHGVREVDFNASVDGLPYVTLTLVADVECLSPDYSIDEGYQE